MVTHRAPSNYWFSFSAGGLEERTTGGGEGVGRWFNLISWLDVGSKREKEREGGWVKLALIALIVLRRV